MKTKKILFAAYRDWAVNAVDLNITWSWNHDRNWSICYSPEELNSLTKNESWDAIILIGWSWKVPSEIVNNNLVVGMHPSDLPAYAGGSPIQNQILDGVSKTKATLFKLNEAFDQGEIIDKEDICLDGHLSNVFDSIIEATSKMVNRFVDDLPQVQLISQQGKKRVMKRLKPEDSKLPLPTESEEQWFECEDDAGFGRTIEVVKKKMTCKEMWDFIRCREDPYPNAYFEDETGKLTIKWVEFEEKDRSNS